MKKLRCAFALLFCILTIFTCAFSASAEEVSYKLKELNMSIKIPDTMSVKTRENSSDLAEGIYLEATSADGALTISVSMIQNEKTQEIYSFVDLPTDTLMEYKEQLLKNDEYIDCTNGVYGKVPFLDFSMKFKTDTGVDVYGMQSVTLINGMNISVNSQSVGDSFTSDELELINSCLESIRFSSIKSPPKDVNIFGIIVWIVVGLIVLVAGFAVLSYFMGRRSAKRKSDAKRERRRKADYDVLKNAEEAKRLEAQRAPVGGYKSSSDYFDNDFEEATPASVPPSALTTEPTAKDKAMVTAEKAVKTTGTAFTHVGYFFKNLKREISHSKKSRSSRKKAKTDRKPRDYDVFRDR